jgi:hypothetical protein
MKLPTSKIESAASKGESRYTLRAVQLDVERKRMMATDGHILAIVPVEVTEADHSGLIGLDVLKSLRAMQKRAKSVPVEVMVNGKVTAEGNGERAEYELVTGQFPNMDMVVPKVATDAPCTFSFNMELLVRLVDALKARDTGKYASGRIVSLYVKDNNSAVLVKVADSEGTGMIMPCRS